MKPDERERSTNGYEFIQRKNRRSVWQINQNPRHLRTHPRKAIRGTGSSIRSSRSVREPLHLGREGFPPSPKKWVASRKRGCTKTPRSGRCSPLAEIRWTPSSVKGGTPRRPPGSTSKKPIK